MQKNYLHEGTAVWQAIFFRTTRKKLRFRQILVGTWTTLFSGELFWDQFFFQNNPPVKNM
jgi:hypothetical protein